MPLALITDVRLDHWETPGSENAGPENAKENPSSAGIWLISRDASTDMVTPFSCRRPLHEMRA